MSRNSAVEAPCSRRELGPAQGELLSQYDEIAARITRSRRLRPQRQRLLASCPDVGDPHRPACRDANAVNHSLFTSASHVKSAEYWESASRAATGSRSRSANWAGETATASSVRGPPLPAIAVAFAAATIANENTYQRTKERLPASMAPPRRPLLKCGACRAVTDGGMHHPYSCGRLKGFATGRHNAIRNALVELARGPATSVSTEPAINAHFDLKPGGAAAAAVTGNATVERRADLAIRDLETGSTTLVDVVVANSMTRTALTVAMPGGGAITAEARKRQDYNANWVFPPDKFVAAGWDTTGAAGKGAAGLLSRIAATKRPGMTVGEYAQLVRTQREVISVTLWRQQAAIIRAWQAAFPSVAEAAQETAALLAKAAELREEDAALWAAIGGGGEGGQEQATSMT